MIGWRAASINSAIPPYQSHVTQTRVTPEHAGAPGALRLEVVGAMAGSSDVMTVARIGGVALTVIRVTEARAEANGSFVILVAFDDATEYETTLRDPATPAAEELLAWYFEQHLLFPFLDKDREQKAVMQLAEYGRSLFGQVFAGAASYDYRRLRDQSFDGCELEITGSAAFHLLHWEALRDPDMDGPLAVGLPVTRRVERLAQKFELPPQHASLNILLVTARPFGPADVGFRTISRPLLDALRKSSLRVTLDLVRPGTWEALRGHLRSQAERHGAGWYQVVHFDVHGGFSEFAELQELVPVQPFDGRRSFLFFETADEGKATPVPAREVASLLAEHRIPVAVINACQSAMQTGSEASLAQHLVQAGVPVAVGMAYSVTVSAATLAMPVLYERLAQGADPVAALHAARQALYHNVSRQAYFDQQLDLEDWVLPVGFGQQPVSLRLRPMDDAEQAHFYQQQADIVDEPSPDYGFVGRDLDIQAVERRLLTGQNTNELLVRGMAGAGKSTLLRHLAWWWQRTSLVEKVFVFSYEHRAWTCSQIMHEIRAKLLNPAEQARANTMPGPAQLEQVAQLLRVTRHLLILDNAESITATPAAIPHALDRGERAQIQTLLSRLRGGQSLVLIGSRESEAWLAPSSFGESTYSLSGLDPQAASTLADRILRRSEAAYWLGDDAERQALDDLIEMLGGYPLPMTVVLPVLGTTAPSQVLAELKAGGSAADPGEDIILAIEYSHGKLDPALQASLLLLAPFTAAIPLGPALDYYRDIVINDATLLDSGEVDLERAVMEAVRVGLASPHLQLRDYVQVQPVLPYFLRSRLRQDDQLRALITQAHYQLYTNLSHQLHELLVTPGDPQRRAAGQVTASVEYANLTAALAHGLKTGQPIIGVILALEEYLDQAQQYSARRRLLDDAIASYPEPISEAQQRELVGLHNLAGIIAHDQHRLDDAKAHHQAELQLAEATSDTKRQAVAYHQLGAVAEAQREFAAAEANYTHALDIFLASGDRRSTANTYHQLGVIGREQRRFAEAEASHRQALAIRLEFGDRHAAANDHHELGMVAQEQGQFAEAEASYRQALAIYLEFGDRYHAASTYHQLGILAQLQHRFAEAETSYRQALAIYLEFGDRYSVHSTYHQLGILAQLQQRFAEAEASYRRGLDIRLELGDRHSAARSYHQLGTAAQLQGRFAEAEASYRQALDIYLEFGDRYSAAGSYFQLGWVAQDQGRFAEAEASYRQALDIYLEFGDRRSAALTYHHLGGAAQRQLRFVEAEAIYRQALDIRLESEDRHLAARIYYGLGTATHRQGRFAEAAACYRQALDNFLESGDRQSAANTYCQLGMVTHQRGRFAEAEACYRQALDIFPEFGDRQSAASAYHQLGMVAQDQGQFAEAEASYLRALEISLEFGDRRSAASSYHQLGTVAQRQGRFAEAEARHRHALDIYPESEDRYSAAGTYYQLGMVAQDQGQFAEAEASYRQALEIFLESGDRQYAANTYRQLGRVAQERDLFAEAEASYRQALDIYLESNPREASVLARSLGLLLAKIDRHTDAALVLLEGALIWHQLAGNWNTADLQHLKRERQLISEASFRQMVTARVPRDLHETFTTAIDNADDLSAPESSRNDP
jgi:tetratricopeptide (TPR) repeat protein